jgi:hypothetical protein
MSVPPDVFPGGVRRTLMLIVTLGITSASADIAVTRSDRIFCTVVGPISDAIQVTLPARETLLLKTDVVELRICDRYRASALMSELPGVAVSFDPAATRETTGTKVQPEPAKPADGCCLTTCCTGPSCLGVGLGVVGGFAAGYGISALLGAGYNAVSYAEIGALLGGLTGVILADELSHPHPKPIPPAPVPRKPTPPRPPGQFVSTLGEVSLAVLTGVAIDWPGVWLLNRGSPVGYGLLAISPVGAAAGTALIGRWLEPRGSFSWSLTGAYAGAIGGTMIGALSVGKFPPTSGFRPFASPILEMWIGSTLGAVLGYKLGPSLGSLETAGRFSAPNLGIVVEPGKAGQPPEVAGVRVNLLGYRF